MNMKTHTWAYGAPGAREIIGQEGARRGRTNNLARLIQRRHCDDSFACDFPGQEDSRRERLALGGVECVRLPARRRDGRRPGRDAVLEADCSCIPALQLQHCADSHAL